MRQDFDPGNAGPMLGVRLTLGLPILCPECAAPGATGMMIRRLHRKGGGLAPVAPRVKKLKPEPQPNIGPSN